MMRMLGYLVVLGVCLCSCEKEQVSMENMIIGKTFGNQSFSITFESSDSVSFKTKNTLYLLNVKSRYKIRNGKIRIESPYIKRPDSDKITESYIEGFTGVLRKDRIEDATFSVIGPNEREQFFGDKITLFVEKTKDHQ